MTDVSQQTMAADHSANPRRYRSPVRSAKSAVTRQKVIEAALALIAEGYFRASSGQITERAGVHRATINYYWGHETLFYRALAREHWERVVVHLPLWPHDLGDGDAAYKAAVWAVLVGEPRELS